MGQRECCKRLGVGAVALLSLVCGSASAGDAARKLNIVLILADDLGYETIGANGGTSYKTPHLDRLAAGGVRFERCYVQPLCTPTRVQLMTGMYNVRNYTTFGQMDPGQTTFANILKKAGYATCIAGKWQLGQDVDLPKRFGFDENCLWQHTRRPPRYAHPGLETSGKEVDYTHGEYGPDIVSDFALDFIARKKDQPFFLYYPMMLTHAPYQPTPDSADWDPKAVGEQVNQSKKHFADMVAYMDKLIGKVVAKLDELSLRQNTLILFVGDNGTGRGTASRMGAREVAGGKGLTTDAGMHVPLIASWPAVMPAARVCSDLVDSTDFLPTICEAAGTPAPAELKIDGRSFLPQLRGEKGTPREWTYCWYSPRGEPPREFAAGQRHKLYRSGEFYDLSSDVLEKKPLQPGGLDAEARAAREKLQAALEQFKDARPADLAKGAKPRKAKGKKGGADPDE